MALKLDHLKVYYQTLHGQVKALDDISLQLKDGEILGVAGESGCGKSTLSNALILLKPPMRFISGEVYLDGEKVPIEEYQKMVAFRFKKISIIPQYAMNAMNPTVKIGRYIQDLLLVRGETPEKVFPELKRRLKLVELSESILDLFPIELSGGMKQRMVMVIATLLNPSLLIADEITSALDVSTQKAVSEMLVEFRNRGFVKSIIFVTHDVSVLYQIADRIFIMYAGKFAEIGPTQTVIHHSRHPYTGMLVQAMPEVGIRYEKQPLTGIPGQPPLLLHPPEGCRFKDRCPFAYGRCNQVPPQTQISEGHEVACWKEVEKDA
ncbi:MAG TPA: ABC transporter ATP-binding protein [Thermotogota bacterium]|nr:ABC transporter ATP-binding protein [Thermotogota bacterium]HRW93634.1 ABC transporter ATP-binding protein [Thermotogota bacterium]